MIVLAYGGAEQMVITAGPWSSDRLSTVTVTQSLHRGLAIHSHLKLIAKNPVVM